MPIPDEDGYYTLQGTKIIGYSRFKNEQDQVQLPKADPRVVQFWNDFDNPPPPPASPLERVIARLADGEPLDVQEREFVDAIKVRRR